MNKVEVEGINIVMWSSQNRKKNIHTDPKRSYL